MPWREGQLRSAYRQFEHLGLFLDDRLLAFVIYQVSIDEAEIIHLVCDKAYQGKGNAEQLLRELVQRLKVQDVTRLFLEVRPSNHKALALYHRVGFLEVGRRTAYYQNKEDAILMRLLIEQSHPVDSIDYLA